MKILECDKMDCPAHSKYVNPEPPVVPTGIYSSTTGTYSAAVGGGGAGSGGLMGVVVGGGGGAGVMTINGVPSYVSSLSWPQISAVPQEKQIYLCFGEIRVHPACLMCSNLPKMDMREVQIAEKAKTMLER
jgi:hypothetical protein